MSNKILVLGSTGKTGSRVAARLQQLNMPVRLGSRNADPCFSWEAPGNWPAVLQGIQKVYISFQPDLAVPGAPEKIKLFTELAAAAGVQQLVLLSGRGEKEAEACEEIVRASGINWTIVRASWFMQNFSENFLVDGILQQEVVLPIVPALEPFIDVDDIADVVVAALTQPQHAQQLYEVTGPELLSFEAATAIIARQLNRPIAFNAIPMEAYVSTLRSYQLPEAYIWLIEYLFTEVLDGRNESVTHDVERALGRGAGSFEAYVAKTMRTGVWN